MKDLRFTVSEAKGEVSGCLDLAPDPRGLVVLGHGAGAGMHHAHMTELTGVLTRSGLTTFRYQFPYMERSMGRGGGRTDALDVCMDTIRAAIDQARALCPDLPLLLAGHSFGGRMSSHYAALNPQGVRGLIYFSFPLHPAKKPAISRAAHLPKITLPQLFLSGDRDALAEGELLASTVADQRFATLEMLETADHGYKVLKRSRKRSDTVYEEAQDALSNWLSRSGVYNPEAQP